MSAVTRLEAGAKVRVRYLDHAPQLDGAQGVVMHNLGPAGPPFEAAGDALFVLIPAHPAYNRRPDLMAAVGIDPGLWALGSNDVEAIDE